MVLDARDPPELYEDEPAYIGDGDQPISALTEAGRVELAAESRARAAGGVAHDSRGVSPLRCD